MKIEWTYCVVTRADASAYMDELVARARAAGLETHVAPSVALGGARAKLLCKLGAKSTPQ